MIHGERSIHTAPLLPVHRRSANRTFKGVQASALHIAQAPPVTPFYTNIGNDQCGFAYTTIRPCCLRFTDGLESFSLVTGRQFIDVLVQIAVHDLFKSMGRQVDAMVCHSALGEIVGANLFAAIA